MHHPHGAWALGVIVLVGLSACGTSYVSTKSPDAALIAGHAPADVRAAIIRALPRSFSGVTESEEAGRIVARIGKPNRAARIAIEYSGTQYLVRYLAGGTMDAKQGPGGEMYVDKRFEDMASRLKGNIADELHRPAREAAQAERDRRQYELLVQQSRAAEARAQVQAMQPAPAPAPAPGAAPSPHPLSNAITAIPAVVNAIAPSIPTVEYRSNTQHGEQTITCCINGARYTCPSQDAFQECMRSGPSSCTPAGRCD